MTTMRSDETVATHGLQKDALNCAQPGGFHALLDVLPVGVFVIDEEQRVCSINPAAAKILGVEAEAAVGSTCEQLMRCRICGPACATCHAQESGQPQLGFPTEIRRRDGTTCSLLIDAVPVDARRVAVILRDVTEGVRIRLAMQALQERWVFHGMLCVSASMKEIVGQIRDVAPYASTVLVLGESGTGKEVVARAIHAESPRSAKPIVAVNCSAYSENLLESELFGHVRGSFTGAERDRRGRFEMAEGGTVFLDEIGEISPKIQVKLLRVLQEREIERVGESKPRAVDIRVVAATNRDLGREVREGRFREDLYYRLNVFTLTLPPLRERREDIPALTDHLLQRISQRTGKNVRRVSEEALAILLHHSWPGNVRELENVIENAVVRVRGEVIAAADLPVPFYADAGPQITSLDRVREALRRTGGCVTRAARLLGMHRTTLWRHMREAGVHRAEFLAG
ncbi:MAG: sigma-54 interaction domain-containing protein [Planctomycetaceae bacterium]